MNGFRQSHPAGQPCTRGRRLGSRWATSQRADTSAKTPVHPGEDIVSTNKRRSGGQNALTEPVAGNGLLHRRALLGGGIAIAGAMGAGPSITGAAAEPLAVDPWTLEPGSNSKAYELPSRFEKNTVRTLSNPNGEPRTQHARTPHHLLNGAITPNGLHFTIVHGGTPDIDPDKHRLAIHGLVKQPKVFTLETLARYPMESRSLFRRVRRQQRADVLARAAARHRAATARAGVVRRMDRRTAVDAAGRSRHRPRREMADRRGRRRAGAGAQRAAQEGAR